MNALSALPLILLVTTSIGCTAIGYGVGSMVDHPSLDLSLPNDDVSEAIGREVEVTLRSRATFEGTFRGTTRAPLERYATRYERWTVWWRDSKLPQLGGPIEATTHEGAARGGSFSGFAEGAVLIDETPLSFARIGSMRDSSGAELDLALMRRELAVGELPVRDAVTVEVDGFLTSLMLNDIESIDVDNGAGGRVVFTAVGLGLDALSVVGIIAYGMAHSGGGTGLLSGSW